MKLQIDGAAEGFAAKLKGQDKEDWKKLQEELATFDRLKPRENPQARFVTEFGPVAPAVYVPDKKKLARSSPVSCRDRSRPAAIPSPGPEAQTSAAARPSRSGSRNPTIRSRRGSL